MAWGTISADERQRIEQLAEEADRIAGHIGVDEFHVAEVIAENTTKKERSTILGASCEGWPMGVL